VTARAWTGARRWFCSTHCLSALDGKVSALVLDVEGAAAEPSRHFERLGWRVTVCTADGDAIDVHISQRLMHAAHGCVGVVAVVAQMPEHDVVQIFVRHSLDQLRHLIVRQVSVPRADALLRCPGALGVAPRGAWHRNWLR